MEKGYGDRILIHDFSYIFLKNDRVAFIGANGCGKTTLMKLLTGKEQPDSGEIIVGQTVKIGYYAQEVTHMDPNMRVIDYVREVAEFVPTTEGSVSAAKMLERFLFEGKRAVYGDRAPFRWGKTAAESAAGADGRAQCSHFG